MKFLPTEIPGKVYGSVTEFISGFLPEKVRNGLVKTAHDKKQFSNGRVTANGTATHGKKSGSVLDGTINKRLQPVDFEWNGPGDNVFITGSFYSWTVKIPLSKKSDKFYARIDLPKGRHEFKFVVNGVWKSSLRYPTVTNSYGDLNNYVDLY